MCIINLSLLLQPFLGSLNATQFCLHTSNSTTHKSKLLAIPIKITTSVTLILVNETIPSKGKLEAKTENKIKVY